MTQPTNTKTSTENNSSNPARCTSCTLHPCEQTNFHPNSICSNYKTELIYEVKLDNNKVDSLVRFTCVVTGEVTEWFNAEIDIAIMSQIAQQLQCRIKDVVPHIIAVEAELGKIGTQENPIELTCLNDIENPLYAGRHVKVTAVVSSSSLTYQIPAEITADVTIRSDEYGKITLETIHDKEIIKPADSINLSLIDVPIDIKERRLKRLFNGNKVSNLTIEKYRTAYFLRVKPPVHTIQQKGDKWIDEHGQEYKYYDIYIITDKPLSFRSATKITLTGIPSPNPKTQRTTLLTYKVEDNEATDNFDVKKLNQLADKYNTLQTIQNRLNWILENTCRHTQIIGRSNVATAVYLAYFTPISVTLHNKPQRGWGLVDIIGDSTTGKSETVKKIAQFLNAGMVISAETASMAGILGATSQMDNRAWFVDWGYLPIMDCKLLAMDGCHKLPSWEWAKTAEVERDGVLTITKAAKATIPTRTRQIKIYNAIDKETSGYPTKQLSEFLYPIQAYPSVADPTIIARRDIAIFVNSRDVSAEQINQNHTTQPDPEFALLSEVLKWCWSGTVEVTFTEEAFTFLLQQATDLYETFHYADIPIVSADMKFKLARLSIALAYLTLSACDDYKTVIVTKEHVEVVVNFLSGEYTKAGLNILAQENKFEILTVEDVDLFFTEIEAKLCNAPIERDVLCDILKSTVLKGRVTADMLRTIFGLVENNQRRPLSAILQSLDLTKHGKSGVYPTPKLIEAFKVTEEFEVLKDFNRVNGFNRAEKGIPYTKNIEKQNLTTYYTEVTEQTEVKPEKVVPDKSSVKTDLYVCYLCEERFMDNDWDEFPEGRAHSSCYAEMKSSQSNMPDFEDKSEPPEGDL
ncbi:MAG: hypothetical protein FWD52_08050 [Candidatus Bathyarchaeota archaeon]|nr:hypothetical protein [Candidatus Termiticorpusculum sp.]